MKTTKKHFEIFREEFWKWVDFFGMKAWEIRILHEQNEGGLASTWADVRARKATIRLSPDWGDDDPVTEDAVRKTAFHEVCELFIWGLGALARARDRNTLDDEIEEQEHIIIRTLENVIFKGMD